MHSKSQENLLKADIWISIGKMLKTKRFLQDLCQEYTKSLSDFKGWVCARAEWVVKQNSQRESQKADIGSLEGGGSGSGHFLRFNWEGEKAMFTAPSDVYDVFTAVYCNNTNTTHALCTTLPHCQNTQHCQHCHKTPSMHNSTGWFFSGDTLTHFERAKSWYSSPWANFLTLFLCSTNLQMYIFTVIDYLWGNSCYKGCLIVKT